MNIQDIIIPHWHEISAENIEVRDNGEPLVSMSEFSNLRIIYEPIYYLNNIPGAINVCYLRECVFRKLYDALALLPEGYGFKIYDAWRPFEVQKFLYDRQVEVLMNEKGKKKEEALVLAKRYVSPPSDNPQKPFVHSTGGAVDLTIVDNNNKELNMGTRFDDFSKLAATDSFESSDNEEVKRNRRLLFGVLTKVGFTNYPSEWWHYDFGNCFWASESKSRNAIYGGIVRV